MLEYGIWRHLLCCRTGSTVLRSRQKSCGRNTLSFWRNTKSTTMERTSRSVSGWAERWRRVNHQQTEQGTGFRFLKILLQMTFNKQVWGVFFSFCFFVTTNCVSHWTGRIYSRRDTWVDGTVGHSMYTNLSEHDGQCLQWAQEPGIYCPWPWFLFVVHHAGPTENNGSGLNRTNCCDAKMF